LARKPKTHSFAASAYVKLPQDRRDVMIDRLRATKTGVSQKRAMKRDHNAMHNGGDARPGAAQGEHAA
jgi:hypothetical protein